MLKFSSELISTKLFIAIAASSGKYPRYRRSDFECVRLRHKYPAQSRVLLPQRVRQYLWQPTRTQTSCISFCERKLKGRVS